MAGKKLKKKPVKRVVKKKKKLVAMPKGHGHRVEVYPTRRKQANGEYRQEWAWRIVARNGKNIGASGESFKHKKYAIKNADRSYPDIPLFVAGELLDPSERPSKQQAPTIVPVTPVTESSPVAAVNEGATPATEEDAPGPEGFEEAPNQPEAEEGSEPK